jgi:hypothetical protein
MNFKTESWFRHMVKFRIISVQFSADQKRAIIPLSHRGVTKTHNIYLSSWRNVVNHRHLRGTVFPIRSRALQIR